jgi:hypothetical protein
MAHLVSWGAISAGFSSSAPELPEGIAPGDVLVLYAVQSTTGAHAVPSGWTAIAELSHPDATLKSFAAYKVATGSDTAPTITWTAGGLVAQIALFRNVLVSAPIEATGAAAYNASQGDVGAISGVTASKDACVVVVGARDVAWGSAATLADGFAEIGERSFFDPAFVWDATTLTADATVADQTFSITSSSNGYGMGIMFALEPMELEVRAHQASLQVQKRPTSTARVSQASLQVQKRPTSTARVSQVSLQVMILVQPSSWRAAFGVQQIGALPGGWESYQ